MCFLGDCSFKGLFWKAARIGELRAAPPATIGTHYGEGDLGVIRHRCPTHEHKCMTAGAGGIR